MSRPLNILSFYRTYAYHHILVMCDGTVTAQKLAGESSQLSKLTSASRSHERFEPQLVSGGGKYIVLANGTSDARFYVESANWETVFAPSEAVGGVPQFSKMQVGGSIVLREPLGVEFMNTLAKGFSEMDIDPVSAVYLLKTIFIGHREDGTSETISTIQPFLFTMMDLKVDFDMTGSIYTADIIGISNGSAKLPLHNGVADGFHFCIPAKQTLKQTMKKLETELNEAYRSWKEDLKQQAICNKVDINFDEDYRDVTYEIVLNPPYDSSQYTGGTNEQVMKGDKQEGDAIITNLGSHASVETLIETVMRSSKEVVQDDKRDENGEGRRFIFKITSVLDTDAGQDSKYIVKFHVHQYEVATNQALEGQDPVNFEPPVDAGIIFDYIFTGRNTDIINFDMKMEMGLAFLLTLGTMNSSPNTGELLGQSNLTTTSANAQQSKNKSRATGTPEVGDPASANDQSKRQKTPLFHGMTVRGSRARNQVDVGGSQSYDALFARHATLENMGVKIKIHGNPQLMADSTPLPNFFDSPDSVSQVIQTDASNQVTLEEQNRAIIPAMHQAPGYVKINVKMPIGTNPTDYPYEDTLVPFWYQGWYRILSLQNSFDTGLFTQEMILYSVIDDSGQIELGDESDCEKDAKVEGDSSSGPGGNASTNSTPKETREGKTAAGLTNEWAARANVGAGPDSDADAAGGFGVAS